MDFKHQNLQNHYNHEIDELNFFSFRCPRCQCVGQFVKHGYYTRSFKFHHHGATGKMKLRVLRVKCQNCESTHALLPSWIVPYSAHLLEDHIEIIDAFESGTPILDIEPENPEIDPSNIFYIIKQYRSLWRQRLLSIHLSLPGDINLFVSSCFKAYERQFMQIKKTTNKLLN